jgi:hypothetical protein
MKKYFFYFLLIINTTNCMSQIVIGPKGTKITLDSSKWKIEGNNLYNKNSGSIGIGTQNPTAQFHTTGDVRLQGIGINTTNSKVLTADALGNITTRLFSNMLSENLISNSLLTQIPSKTFKGRTSTGTGNVEDLTSTEATAMLNIFSPSTKGLVPASGGGTTSFLRADGNFAVPTGNNYRNVITLSTDIINNNATANTLEDVIGLAFDVTAGITYRFYALIPYTSAAANNGSRWTINAPASSMLNYVSRYTLSATTETVNYANAINLPSACNNNSTLNANIAIIEGVLKPTANGTVQIRFASEGANTAITAKAGATLEYW